VAVAKPHQPARGFVHPSKITAHNGLGPFEELPGERGQAFAEESFI